MWSGIFHRLINGTDIQKCWNFSGIAKNWAYSVGGFNYSYTIELPPKYSLIPLEGFDFPENEILEVGKEQYAGLMAMLKYLKDLLVNL